LLRGLSAEWDANVVCGWFDDNNTEDARTFVSRAETFFQTYGKASLLHYADSFEGYSTQITGPRLNDVQQLNPYTIRSSRTWTVG
jgi:hypothetical protein